MKHKGKVILLLPFFERMARLLFLIFSADKLVFSSFCLSFEGIVVAKDK